MTSCCRSARRDVRLEGCDPRVRPSPSPLSPPLTTTLDRPETTTCTGDLAIAQAEIGRLKKLVDLLMTRLESPPAPPGRHHPYARSSSKNLPPSGHTVEDAEALLSFANALTTSPTETFSYPAQSFPLPPAFPSPDFPFSSPAPSFPSPAPAFSSQASQPSSRTFSHPTFPTPYPIAPLRPQKSLEAKNHAARYDAAIAAFLATKAGEGPLLGGGGGRVEEEEVRGGVEGGVGPMLSDVRSEREEMGEEREEKMELGWEK